MRDNFGNVGTATTAPKLYTYGLFAFTKAMLLHSPGGVLTPITFLHSTTAGVVDLDWYGAEVSSGAPTDGVARTLVNRQNAAGYWTGVDFTSAQFPFETAWSIIMLRRTTFVACVTNLGGRGTPRGVSPARIDLTWTGIANVDHYNVLRSTILGGPYSLVGSAPGANQTFSDTSGLLNGHTYFYVLQPISATGGAICQSNEAKVTIPAGR